MAEIIIEGKVPSITVNKEFLIDLFKIITSKNPKNILIKTQIILENERETRTYENLRDFTSVRHLPRDIRTIEIVKEPVKENDKKRVISFYLLINTNVPGESYYELTGYDEGKLEICKKEINSLIDEYKTWYWFLFIGVKSGDEESKGMYQLIFLTIAVSLSFTTYRILNLIRGIKQSDSNVGIAFISFFGFAWLLGKVDNRLFPYLDIQITKVKRSKFWYFVISTIILGLVVNLIWEFIKLIWK